MPALTLIVPHALRGNAAQDAPRPLSNVAQMCAQAPGLSASCARLTESAIRAICDAERHGMHAHAERWARSVSGMIVPHALRGNAAQDAPRPLLNVAQMRAQAPALSTSCARLTASLVCAICDAERHGRHAHAERWARSVSGMIVPHALRGNAAQDAPRPLLNVAQMRARAQALSTSCARLTESLVCAICDAERPGMHAHAERWARSG